MKWYMLTILILCVVIAIIIWAVVYSFSEPTINKAVETYAVVKEFKSKAGSGRNAVYEYSVNGEVFSFWGYYNNTLVIGDKFIVMYDCEKPKESKVVLDKPIFLENEKTINSKGKITRVKIYSKKAVYFEYVANGELYTRIQCLPNDFKVQYPALSEEKEYQIVYWADNPQRAIIYLDKPL